MSKYSGLLLDLDGTLVHTSYEYRKFILYKTLGDLNIDTPSRSSIDRFWFGQKRNKMIKKSFGIDSDEFWDIYSNYETVDFRKKHIKPYSDVDFLKRLKERGYKMGILTGAPKEIAECELEMLKNDIEEDNLFENILTASDQEVEHKPNPGGIYKLMEELEIGKEEAIFIGNGEEDLEASQNAGIDFVLMDRGEYDFGIDSETRKIEKLYELENLL